MKRQTVMNAKDKANGQVLELVCPAGTPAAFKAAVEAGADTIYLGFRDETNARNFPGLNFSREELREAIAFAGARGRKVMVAINTYPRAGAQEIWHRAVDDAANLGAHAVILADLGLIAYAAQKHPKLRRHLSVQASASTPDAISFYVATYGISRVVLPRVLTLAEIAALTPQLSVEVEVFAFGGLCVMAEGRCALSSYATGLSPNMNGVCSPASHVRYLRKGDQMISKLGDFTINRFSSEEAAGYPTICKGRYRVRGRSCYPFEEPTSLNMAGYLGELAAAGVKALKIEGRQRGRAYVSQIVAAFREARDALADGKDVSPVNLSALTEGQRETAGAYQKTWR